MHAVAARRRRHPVECQRHVRPHRLALAIRQRPVVAAAGSERGDPGARRRSQLGLRPRAHPDPLTGDRDAPLDVDVDADRRERRAVRERDGRPGRAVRRGDPLRRRAAQRDVGVLLEVPGVGAAGEARRLEQPVIGLPHRAGAGERREIGGALRGVAHLQAARHGSEHERADAYREEPADEQHRHLPARLARMPEQPPAGGMPARHGASRGSERRRARPAIAAQRGGPGRQWRDHRALASAERRERHVAQRGIDVGGQSRERDVDIGQQRLEGRRARPRDREHDGSLGEGEAAPHAARRRRRVRLERNPGKASARGRGQPVGREPRGESTRARGRRAGRGWRRRRPLRLVRRRRRGGSPDAQQRGGRAGPRAQLAGAGRRDGHDGRRRTEHGRRRVGAPRRPRRRRPAAPVTGSSQGRRVLPRRRRGSPRTGAGTPAPTAGQGPRVATPRTSPPGASAATSSRRRACMRRAPWRTGRPPGSRAGSAAAP